MTMGRNTGHPFGAEHPPSVLVSKYRRTAARSVIKILLPSCFVQPISIFKMLRQIFLTPFGYLQQSGQFLSPVFHRPGDMSPHRFLHQYHGIRIGRPCKIPHIEVHIATDLYKPGTDLPALDDRRGVIDEDLIACLVDKITRLLFGKEHQEDIVHLDPVFQHAVHFLPADSLFVCHRQGDRRMSIASVLHDSVAIRKTVHPDTYPPLEQVPYHDIEDAQIRSPVQKDMVSQQGKQKEKQISINIAATEYSMLLHPKQQIHLSKVQQYDQYQGKYKEKQAPLPMGQPVYGPGEVHHEYVKKNTGHQHIQPQHRDGDTVHRPKVFPAQIIGNIPEVLSRNDDISNKTGKKYFPKNQLPHRLDFLSTNSIN